MGAEHLGVGSRAGQRKKLRELEEAEATLRGTFTEACEDLKAAETGPRKRHLRAIARKALVDLKALAAERADVGTWGEES